MARLDAGMELFRHDLEDPDDGGEAMVLTDEDRQGEKIGFVQALIAELIRYTKLIVHRGLRPETVQGIA